jgi:peptidoglycan/LPS O-acetylase OafA/YrhL
LKVILDTNTYLVGALEIVSGICLFYAVHQINKYVKESGSSINKRALIVHSISFGLYLVGVIVMDGFYFNYQVKESVSSEAESARQRFMKAEVFWVCTSFVAQLLLCAIFWQLGKVREE